MSVLVDSLNVEFAAKSYNRLIWIDFITGEVVVTNKAQTRLVNIKSEWQPLSSQEKSKGIATIIRMVNLSNFNSVIC